MSAIRLQASRGYFFFDLGVDLRPVGTNFGTLGINFRPLGVVLGSGVRFFLHLEVLLRLLGVDCWSLGVDWRVDFRYLLVGCGVSESILGLIGVHSEAIDPQTLVIDSLRLRIDSQSAIFLDKIEKSHVFRMKGRQKYVILIKKQNT